MHWFHLYTVRIADWITLAFACSTTYISAQSGEAPRNILLLMCDHFRYDATGYAGNPYAVTPNLDKLAASGTVFSRTYCQNPLCVPSRTSILTSRYSRSTGVYGNGDVVSRDVTSFTQILRAGGLKTACFGKLHVQGRDDLDWDIVESGGRGSGGRGARRRADDGRRGRPRAEGERPREERRARAREEGDRSRDERPGRTRGRNRSRRGRGRSQGGGRPVDMDEKLHGDFQAMQGTIKFMEENRDRAWFIQCSFRKPHPPFEPPKRHWERIDRSKLVVPRYPDGDLKDTGLLSRRGRGGGELDDKTVLDAMQGYYGCIAFCDDMFGQVLTTLDRLGLRQETLVVFTADHGEMLYDHGLWGKTNFFEPSVHVPLIFSWPGHLPKGRTSDALVELTDLFPTFVDVLGLKTPASVEGRSVLPVLRGKATRHRDLVHSESRAGMTMQFDGRLKFILNGAGAGPELYDLQKDPREITNLAKQPSYQKQVKELTAQLVAWKNQDQLEAAATPRGPDSKRKGGE